MSIEFNKMLYICNVMKEYQIKDEFEVEAQVESLVEEEIGDVKKKDDNRFVVTEPDNPVLNKFVVVKLESKVKLEIEEIGVNKLMNSDIDDDNVVDATQSKNQVLFELTGFTASERKKKMKKEVLPDSEIVNLPQI